MLSLPIMYFFSGNSQFLKDLETMINADQVGSLMIIYGLGAACIFLTLAWMYQYAKKQAEALELDEIELFDTSTSLKSNLLMASIPLVSVLIAILFHSNKFVGAYAGFTYFLYTPAMFWFAYKSEKKRKKLIARMV
jgi:divalent metal cation (Fe/Co/Zn/Cd) transporter